MLSQHPAWFITQVVFYLLKVSVTNSALTWFKVIRADNLSSTHIVKLVNVKLASQLAHKLNCSSDPTLTNPSQVYKDPVRRPAKYRTQTSKPGVRHTNYKAPTSLTLYSQNEVYLMSNLQLAFFYCQQTHTKTK